MTDDAATGTGPVLVTGATGFLGASLIAHLLAEGVAVAAFDIREDRTLLADLAGAETAGRVDWTTGDVADAETLDTAVAKARPAAIAHLAALTIPACREAPARGTAVNVLGHVNMLEAALRHGVDRVLYTSSTAAHPRGPLNAPGNLYGATKRAVEDLSKTFFLDQGLPSVGVRPNVVYGYGRTGGETAAFSEAIRAAVAGERYRMPFTGRMCFQYVSEVVDVMARCLAVTPDAPVVGDITTRAESSDDFIAAIHAEIPDATVVRAETERAPPDVPLDAAPLRDLIGDWPGVSLREGVRRTIAAHRRRS